MLCSNLCHEHCVTQVDISTVLCSASPASHYVLVGSNQ